jgi:predicted lipoprotein with Yx(FWY)xxD motif
MKLKYIASLTLTIVVAGIAVVAFGAGGGSAKAGQPPVAAGSAIGIRNTPLGKTLVDANGRTLYLFAADKTDVSTLSAAGRAVWPPFTSAGTVKAQGGAQAAKIATVTGPGRTTQVSYNGHPLYYYAGDSSPGSTRGQHLKEFGALWYVLAPGGSAITSAQITPAAAPAAPAGGYGY